MGKEKDAIKYSAELRAYLDEQFAKINADNEAQTEALNQIKDRLDALESDTFDVHAMCAELKEENGRLKKEVQDMKWQLDQVDAYTRLDNLRFYNIPEKATENTEDVLITFIENNLQLDTKHMQFSVVHRLGPVTNANNRGGRCILARFLRRVDVNKVKAAAVKLRGTKFGISEDLPASWAEIRRQAHPAIVRPAREAGKRVRWRGRKLFVDGREVNIDSRSKTREHVLPSSPGTSRPQSPPPAPSKSSYRLPPKEQRAAGRRKGRGNDYEQPEAEENPKTTKTKTRNDDDSDSADSSISTSSPGSVGKLRSNYITRLQAFRRDKP